MVKLSDIVWIDVPIGYAFHPMNAYDTADGNVVIDICNYDVMFDLDVLGPFGDRTLPRFERWELNPSARTASITLDRRLPQRVPPASRLAVGQAVPLRLLRLSVVRSFGRVAHASSTIFRPALARCSTTAPDGLPASRCSSPARAVPRRTTAGWSPTCTTSPPRRAEFVVIDAQDFGRADYVAKVPLPQRMPFGFHGNWVSDRSVPPPT